MGIDDINLSAGEVRSRLHALFETAKATDEFGFACTLMRVRGMEDPGWDPFAETHQLVTDLMTLISAPLVTYTKVRLGLLLYSHLTEVGSIYEILANLTRVVAGERYAIDPFLDHYPRNRKGEPQFLSTPGKVRALKEMLDAIGRPAVGEALDWFLNASVRNAFAHADYTLHAESFRARSEWFEVGGLQRPEVPLTVLGDLLNRALAFYGEFMREHGEQRAGYKANKVIAGRIVEDSDPVPVELLADADRGLYGLRAPPGESWDVAANDVPAPAEPLANLNTPGEIRPIHTSALTRVPQLVGIQWARSRCFPCKSMGWGSARRQKL
jgi:hypothetical protein